MKAALYLRISQDRTGEHLGVDRQREDCTELADTLGWDIAHTYEDNDTSAYKDRPGYTAMLEDVKAGKVEAIIAWAPDRIYRRLKDLETLIEIIEANGVQIRTVKAGDLDLSTAYGRMLARILGSVAAGEGEIKSERWRRSWRQGREAGKFAMNGNRCYGYTKDGDIIPEEAETARWMATEILAGKSMESVGSELERRGILTSYGNPWTLPQIKRYLLNPRIGGWAAIKREDKNADRKHGYDIIGEGNWEPILDRETWEALQAFLGARTRPYVPRKALLGRLITCGACGQKMITSKAKGARTYRCPNRPGMRGCGGSSGKAEPIEEMVEEYAKQRLLDPRTRKNLNELRAEGDGGPRAELAAIELRLIDLEKQLDDPAVPLEAVTRAIQRAHEKQDELRKQVAARQQVEIPVRETDWPTDLIHRRQLVDLAVEAVRLNPATKPSRLGFDTERVEIDGRA